MSILTSRGFKQPLERCKLLNRWAFEYFDQTTSANKRRNHAGMVPADQRPIRFGARG